MKNSVWIMIFFTYSVLFLAGCSPTPTGCGKSSSGVVVTDAWVRPSTGQPANPGSSAAYMVLTNCGKENDRLLRVESPAAGMAEVHKSEMKDGMMVMSPVSALDLPAGSQLIFKPGEFHIMMMNLKAPIFEGQTVKFILTFEKAGQVSLEAPVKNQ